MANKMLIDATHPEETRVVVLRGNRVEEFDFESANRKQLRGNIYLAKVTRVEPSLQAAFVEYGGNRHGFLAFSEIHPDYYQIPVADRQALLAEEERVERAADAEADHRAGRGRHRGRNAERSRGRDVVRSEQAAGEGGVPEADEISAEGHVDTAAADTGASEGALAEATPAAEQSEPTEPAFIAETSQPVTGEAPQEGTEPAPVVAEGAEAAAMDEHAAESHDTGEHAESTPQGDGPGAEEIHEEESVESVGGADALEEVQERLPRVRPRQYKIQEVIKRRQVMLVQVVKEERGTKGAALTTYLSLAGRYSVLMPNTARGGGISRKITSADDRKRLKEIAQDLEVPEGMGVILRTAGANRTKTEVKRDFEYLLRMWETVRDLTLKSSAPTLVYEEGSLVKRSIRDLYNKDIDEVIVSGDEAQKEAKDFMRMLMPSHAKNVKLYKDTQPLFTRYGIESQLDAMFSPVVQLKSGGYIVLNQAEALVAIDVNSGRATREHHIEDTALKTNLEAAEEIARQLRLRDLAGLIVIDFIDMDEGRNNRSVERRLKECLKHDRARIQVGRISHFGLLEMSRQRIRTSVLESSTEKCPICGGSGHVRSVSSVTLQLLRAVEEMLIKGATHNLIVRTRAEVALYVLNQKRSHLRALEERFRITITISADATIVGQQSFVIERGEQVHTPEAARALAAQAEPISPIVEEEEEDVVETDAELEAEAEAAAGEDVEQDAQPAPDGEHEREDGGRRRRRRRRRGGRGRGEGREPRSEGGQPAAEHAPAQFAPDAAPEQHADDFGGGEMQPHEDEGGDAPVFEGRQNGDQQGGNGEGRRRRRRGRRGGRRHRRNGDQPYGEQPFAPAEFQGNVEPEAHEAAHDLDQPRAYEQPRFEPSAPSDEERAAPAGEAPAPAPSPAESDAPRRRSTVREAAPVAASAPTPAPSPAPSAPAQPPVVVSGPEPEAGPPKRGWWGRRLMGDKG
ncbi:MAG TPA: ribonuclease E/G [Pseudolabrys sp.]|nr:ribonuclease E/G [Pseudolabrys sp.]